MSGGRRILSGRAVGAVAGQGSQALGSFVLQVIAARSLGATGLGTFALLYSFMLLATALVGGLVGDSYTVLDRGRPDVRSALVVWGLIASLTAGIGGGIAFWAFGVLSVTGAGLFALAAIAFTIESTLRCFLMATMRFWYLVLVDLAALVVTVGAWGAVGIESINTLLLVWFVGQLAALVVAVCCLPRAERHIGPWAAPAMRHVAAFGSWRAMQQGIRPVTLTVSRFFIAAAAGTAAFGQLEAARVYMAPALLLVTGVGSYLFSSYAVQKGQSMSASVTRADRASMALIALTLLMGLVATVLTPWLGPVVTGESFSIVPLAVFGWAVFAASSASVLPYAGLAAVRGKQRFVMLTRGGDAVLSVIALYPLLFMLQVDVSWVPYLLSIGSFVGAVVIRRWVLVPMRDLEAGVATSGVEAVVAKVGISR